MTGPGSRATQTMSAEKMRNVSVYETSRCVRKTPGRWIVLRW
jgi:hypothetical protein